MQSYLYIPKSKSIYLEAGNPSVSPVLKSSQESECHLIHSTRKGNSSTSTLGEALQRLWHWAPSPRKKKSEETTATPSGFTQVTSVATDVPNST